MRGFLDIFFKIVSILGHPILLPTYFALTINVMYGLNPFLVFGISFVFPMLVMLLLFSVSQLLRKRVYDGTEAVLNQEDITAMSGSFVERIEDFFGNTRTRTFAMLIVIGFSVLGYFVYRLPMWSLLMLLITVASLGCMLINNFWRLSIHSYGWGFATYLVVFQYSYVFDSGIVMSMIVILLSGLVMSSRLYLGRHNNLQVHLGYFLGMAVPALLYWALSM
ncbi:MAG: hypothetical protein J6T63_04070 [Bacteroidales bacterium]|nr:hypothetical protein [Bacteroidales bacterium]